MNSRSQTFDLEVEGYQVDEAVASIFHSVLLHRSLDLTYVCCSSPQLERRLKDDISVFSRALRRDDGPYCRGKISLEFYQRKRAWWPFHSEMTPWEAWDLRIELVQLNTEAERAMFREKLGALLSEKIMRIAQVINRNDYVPKVPDQKDLDLVFDTTYEDVQPYLFQISFVTATPPPPTVGSTVKKILRETLYM